MRFRSGITTSRRGALATIGAGGAALLTPPAFRSARAASVEMARGVVYANDSGDGRRRPGDRGVSGALVSNGCDVVATDEDGRWALPLGDGDSAFVIAPRGWAAPAVSGIPQFSRLHQSAGTPTEAGISATGVLPTGPLPRSIDFPLIPRAEHRTFEALLVADTQAANAIELDYVRRDVLHATSRCKAAFAIHHGDAMGDDLDLLDPYVRLLGETGIDWHHCPGNHDMNLDAIDPRFAFDTWKRVIGPTHYAFHHGDALFIVLNNVAYFGRGRHGLGGRGYEGRIGRRQLEFVANLLSRTPRETLIVVSMHIPLVCFDAPDSAADTTADRASLLRLLSPFANAISFAGHSHTTEHHALGAEHGYVGATPHRHQVLTAASGSWWSGPIGSDGAPVADSRDGAPRGFHVLRVDGSKAETRFEALGAGAPKLLRLMIVDRLRREAAFNGRVARDRLADFEIVVNVFDGRPACAVALDFTAAGGPRIAMRREAICDPHVVDSYARHRALCKPWVEAAPSSHVWTSALPDGLRAGRHSIAVSIDDGAGRRLDSRAILDIAG